MSNGGLVFYVEWGLVFYVEWGVSVLYRVGG